VKNAPNVGWLTNWTLADNNKWN